MNRYANRAWAGLVLYIIAVEIAAPKNELLSHAFDRGLETKPGRFLLPAITLITALHLNNALPSVVDPYAWAFRWKEKVNPQTTDNG